MISISCSKLTGVQQPTPLIAPQITPIDITKYASVIGALLIILGVFRLTVYYFVFGVDIVGY
jgi:hypothetical protein